MNTIFPKFVPAKGRPVLSDSEAHNAGRKSEGDFWVKDYMEQLSVNIRASESQIAVEHNGETSVIPLDEDGFFNTDEQFVADSHHARLLDIAKGTYEYHYNDELTK